MVPDRGAGARACRIVLHRAREADLPALNRLMQASRAYEGEYRRMLDGYIIAADQIARDHVVLADRDGEVLGFYSLITGREPELDLMFVTDGAQGTGLGARLFRHMQAEAARLDLSSVRIVSHPPAAGFYERMGAVRVGTRPGGGRITWERPVLVLPVRPPGTTSRRAVDSGVEPAPSAGGG
jgi:GNAT superfamily N-acetyltransferase